MGCPNFFGASIFSEFVFQIAHLFEHSFGGCWQNGHDKLLGHVWSYILGPACRLWEAEEATEARQRPSFQTVLDWSTGRKPLTYWFRCVSLETCWRSNGRTPRNQAFAKCTCFSLISGSFGGAKHFQTSPKNPLFDSWVVFARPLPS